MFINARLGCFALASFLGIAVATAQQSSPSSQGQIGGPRMDLEVVVAPKSGAPVGGLQQQDFTIFDGKAQQTITSFQAVTGRDAPTEIVLAIDAVNDTGQTVRTERIGIDKFLRADEGNLAYPVELAAFTDKGLEKVAGFSSDGNALGDALQKNDIGLRDIGSTAGVWGAAERLQRSLLALRQIVGSEAPRPGRKLILWISSGWPLLNGPNISIGPKEQQQVFDDIVAISTQLLRGRITLYSVDAIGTGESVLRTLDYKNFLKAVDKPSQAQLGNVALQVFAVHSGGLALGASNDVQGLLRECVADSAPYYEISFVAPSSQRWEEYHPLEIRVDKPGLTARTTQGYYVQP